MKQHVIASANIALWYALSWIADAASKDWALSHSKASIVTFVPGFLQALVPPLRNYSAGSLIPGADLGPLAAAAQHGTLVIPVLLSMGAGAYMYRVQNSSERLTFAEQVGFGMLLGSTFSNLSDRICRHCVIDFLHLSIFDFWLWNIADVGICLGLFLVGIEALRLQRLFPAAAAKATSAPSPK